MTKPTPRTLIIAPVLAIGVSVVIVQVASAASGLQLGQRIDGARGMVQDLVHEGASRVAAETGSSASSEPIRTQPARAQPDRILQSDRRLARPGSRARTNRAARGADAMPKRRLRGQSVPDFAAMQEDAQTQASSDVGEHSGRRPPR